MHGEHIIPGRIVYSTTISYDSGNTIIQLPVTLPAGEYLVKLVFETEIAISKVVKK